MSAADLALQHWAEQRLQIPTREAERRIDNWYARGFVMYSDIITHSTHLSSIVPPAGRPDTHAKSPSGAAGSL